MNKVITKWIEPYVLLEELKKSCEMKNFIFDGISKKQIKKKFFEALDNNDTFGLYMKNVNQFYVFKGKINLETLLKLSEDNIENIKDKDTVINMIDMGKAEAGFIGL